MAFPQQTGYVPERTVEVKLLNKKDERLVSYKGVRVRAFSPECTANVFLPDLRRAEQRLQQLGRGEAHPS